MRRDQHLARLPQISARIKSWQLKAEAAERAKDMTAWDDARRQIKKLTDERTQILLNHH